MPEPLVHIPGLSPEEVALSREKFGENTVVSGRENGFLATAKRIIRDPMVVLLWVASSIYFISGKIGDGIFLAAAIVFQASISLYQYSRSKNALEQLKDLSQPFSKVIRNGKIEEVKSRDLVVGDSLVVEEGTLISADGILVQSHDFSVNESILTGESLSVFKDAASEDRRIHSGTTVESGSAIATITAIGNETRLGKIGRSVEGIREEKTPLEVQIANFVTKMAMAGAVVFVLVWVLNFLQTRDFLSSLLRSLTLAMSILPEEIPVAFTTFMALGAWRLMKRGILVKQMKTVETLGSATVICTDKTGTITENNMRVAKLYSLASNRIADATEALHPDEIQLIARAMWASEPRPFDPMEMALHTAYGQLSDRDERPDFRLIREYPLGGKPPMMTHILEDHRGQIRVAAKGAAEALMAVSHLSPSDRAQVEAVVSRLAGEGYRVLGVGHAAVTGPDFPAQQQDLPFAFAGLVAFYDPPKPGVEQVLEDFYTAGISVKIITGDYAATTVAIARQIGFRGHEKATTGDELMNMEEAELKACVRDTHIFTRMYPEAKLRVINALKSNRQIVAMVGDGVNDGPALKAAHIGIAMGKKGTEIARQAASLVLLEDDLGKLVEAVAMGRKVYANLKRAIQYIISIHIPIILTVFIPLALGWRYPSIFSPIHVIFLEIIMGPTCSIVYENEPMERNAMQARPKPWTLTFFTWKELSLSIVQGLAIASAALGVYQYALAQGYTESLTRTLVFTVLVIANVFLTLINRSFFYSVFTTLRYRNNLVLFIVLGTLFLLGLLLMVHPLTVFFEFEPLTPAQAGICLAAGGLSTIWFEGVKWLRRRAHSGKPAISAS